MGRNYIDILQIILILMTRRLGMPCANLETVMTLDRRGVLALAAGAMALTMALPARAEAPVAVVATTGMIADAARAVGGDLVEVQALMGAGVDPHSYRQTRTDILAMTRADVVLWHGLYLEAQMEQFLADLAARQPVVAVGEAVPVELRIAHDNYDGRFDPHVWMDPDLWAFVVGGVTEALVEVHPEGEASVPRERCRRIWLIWNGFRPMPTRCWGPCRRTPVCS
jgi:manganese/zinc/iron transport system substrate-binding protein